MLCTTLPIAQVGDAAWPLCLHSNCHSGVAVVCLVGLCLSHWLGNLDCPGLDHAGAVAHVSTAAASSKDRFDLTEIVEQTGER